MTSVTGTPAVRASCSAPSRMCAGGVPSRFLLVALASPVASSMWLMVSSGVGLAFAGMVTSAARAGGMAVACLVSRIALIELVYTRDQPGHHHRQCGPADHR